MNFSQIQSKLQQFTVGIAGAGGLGSNCAAALVRSGIGKLIIADFDRVDESNLNRQFYFRDQIGQFKVVALRENLLRINPDLSLEIHQIRLDQKLIQSIYQEVDILIEAFDQADQKEMLLETALDTWPNRPVVLGNGMAGFGRIDLLQIRNSGSLFICGDGAREIGPENPPLAPRVGVVAHMQADKTIEILLSQ